MTLAELNKRAMELGRDRAAKIAARKAEADKDPMMTPAARGEYVEMWTRDIDRKYEQAMGELREEADYTARQITRDGDHVRPTFDPDSPADLTRTEQAWRNVVLPQLEKGRTLNQALRNADRDAVLGAERFAAGWLNANRTSDESFEQRMAGEATRDFSAEVKTAVTERFADLADPGAADALRAAARVDTELAAFNQVATMTDEGGRDLEAAILSHYAAQPTPVDAESVDA